MRTGLFDNVETNMSDARHTRPELLGNYRIIWARSLLTREVSYRVYYREAMDPMSEHPTKLQARAAAKRYQAADERRERDRKNGKEVGITEHLKTLGVLGPLP
jgi:hypothetical protein